MPSAGGRAGVRFDERAFEQDAGRLSLAGRTAIAQAGDEFEPALMRCARIAPSSRGTSVRPVQLGGELDELVTAVQAFLRALLASDTSVKLATLLRTGGPIIRPAPQRLRHARRAVALVGRVWHSADGTPRSSSA